MKFLVFDMVAYSTKDRSFHCNIERCGCGELALCQMRHLAGCMYTRVPRSALIQSLALARWQGNGIATNPFSSKARISRAWLCGAVEIGCQWAKWRCSKYLRIPKSIASIAWLSLDAIRLGFSFRIGFMTDRVVLMSQGLLCSAC